MQIHIISVSGHFIHFIFKICQNFVGIIKNIFKFSYRLSSGRLNGLGGDLRSSAIGGVTRCNVSLKGNGVKILTAGNNLTSGAPVIECKGRIMLAKQYRESNKAKGDGLIPPYVFFYQLSDTLEICLDGKTYGNDGRFCRRSATYNAELKHVIDKGIHFLGVFL